MAGRGGRGSALLRALEEPARKPGVTATQQPGPSGDHTTQQPAGKPRTSGGRGSYLLSMIPRAPEPDTPASGGMPIPTPTSTLSRQSLASSTAQSSGKAKPSGRGAALLEMCGPSPPRPVRQVKPLSPPQTGVQVPTASMKKLNLNEPPSESAAPSQVRHAPERPKGPRGETGRRINLSANYIRLKSKSSSWYQYSVSYSPNVDSRGMRYKLLYMHSDIIGPARVFDGNILFLPHELPSKVTSLFSKNPYSGESITLKVSHVKTISILSRQCVQMYNVLFKRIMNILNMVQIGKTSSYSPEAAISIPQHKLQVWPGFVTTVEEYDGGLLLMCDVSHKVLREQTAYGVMNDIFQNPNIPAGEKRTRVVKALIGKSVITRYNNKTYKVDDISFETTPQSTFERREGPISYMQYYHNQYGIQIKDANQPMIITRPKQKDRRTGEMKEELISLIPELTYMTGLTDEMKQNFRVMKDIAVHTRVTPQNRAVALRKFLENIRNSQEASTQLSMWGLEIEGDTIQMEGRQFEPEQIFLGNRYRCSAGPKADWTREITNNVVTNPVDLTNWVLVFTHRDRQKAMRYFNEYQKIGPQLGINVAMPKDIALADDRVATYINAVRDAVNNRVQLVVVLFPTKREDKYNAVKKLLCSERPCPSQMIITKTISDDRKLRSVVQKISLQINAKLGGELWQLNIPLKNTMYVGIDVYHDGAKGKSRSVTGMVASLNKAATRYYSRVSTQGPGEELINGLKTCFIAALKKYHEVNNVLPDKVIVFRDGVGDSMLEIVAEHEVKQLSTCFSTFEQYRQQLPGLTVIVVQKRINSRLYAVNRGVKENPPPGTIVDHTMTKANWFDYYLVSQHVTQGTVMPAHYVVIHDTSQLKPDNLQQLSYKMCHLYYNWAGTVRVPAPCQYAHKLAYLIGENVRRDPSEELADKLYYL
ncbi:piwi-like protein Ago3 isoform X2 [Watersipora subatra]|uniref:piwi-like protein Ago3 isoform X2 n=1 Tax=Watersipora subatra TaxID=2589382 RepID=UPI00355BB782